MIRRFLDRIDPDVALLVGALGFIVWGCWTWRDLRRAEMQQDVELLELRLDTHRAQEMAREMEFWPRPAGAEIDE
jgi:hypothetical protein